MTGKAAMRLFPHVEWSIFWIFWTHICVVGSIFGRYDIEVAGSRLTFECVQRIDTVGGSEISISPYIIGL